MRWRCAGSPRSRTLVTSMRRHEGPPRVRPRGPTMRAMSDSRKRWPSASRLAVAAAAVLAAVLALGGMATGPSGSTAGAPARTIPTERSLPAAPIRAFVLAQPGAIPALQPEDRATPRPRRVRASPRTSRGGRTSRTSQRATPAAQEQPAAPRSLPSAPAPPPSTSVPVAPLAPPPAPPREAVPSPAPRAQQPQGRPAPQRAPAPQPPPVAFDDQG